jgi:hypothetical protein
MQETFARLALTRASLVAALGLELRILGEQPQALEGRADAVAHLDPPSADVYGLHRPAITFADSPHRRYFYRLPLTLFHDHCLFQI